MGLSIHQQSAQIGIQTSRAKLDISTQKHQLSIQRENTSINIESELPRVIIDQYPCRATSGLKNMKDFRTQQLEIAVQNLNEFMARRASEGAVLGGIENRGAPNAFGQVAASRLKDEKQFGMVTMPSQRPNIRVEGNLDIKWNRTWEGALNGVKYQFTPGKININFTPGKVEIYMRQMNKLEYSYQQDSQIDELG